MTHVPRFSTRIAATVLTTLSLWLGSNLTLSAFAQYVPPNNLCIPGRREGGGTRGDCLNSPQPLMALMPENSYGETISAYPTFFWFVPDVPAQAAEFVLYDDDGNEVYYTTFRVTGTSGILSLTLPETADLLPLEMGKSYEWVFSLICDEQDRSGDLFTTGWLRRVESTPTLQQQLTTATTSDRANVYAQQGLWYDALAEIATQYRANPSDAAIANQWTLLLNSVGLASFTSEPLLPNPNADAPPPTE
jgi:hypothetical protein